MASLLSNRASLLHPAPSARRAAPLVPASGAVRTAFTGAGVRRSGAAVVRASLDERKAVIESFYGNLSRSNLEALLADDFKMAEEGGSKVYTKQDYIAVLCDCVMRACPDFKWGAATNAETDKEGYAIVTVAATGHHTGEPLVLPGLEPVPPSGRHFCLADEVQKVRVNGSKIQEVLVLPNKGAGPRALYVALGGKLPVSSGAAAGAPPMP